MVNSDDAVVFRRDAMTPHETREMQKAGWRRREHSDGRVSWFPPPRPCPICGNAYALVDKDWCDCSDG